MVLIQAWSWLSRRERLSVENKSPLDKRTNSLVEKRSLTEICSCYVAHVLQDNLAPLVELVNLNFKVEDVDLEMHGCGALLIRGPAVPWSP